MTKADRKEEVFIKCKESLEDVAGWKIFVFLPQSFVWRLFIVATVIFTYIMRTFEFFYGLTFNQYYYAELACNVMYFVDALSSTLHALMVNTRKLRHGKKRPFLLLLIDYISLIPFQIVQRFFIYGGDHNFLGIVLQNLRINICLRMYQLFLIFNETRYWIYQMRIYFFVIVISIVTSTIIISHFLSCIYFYFLSDAEKKTCLKVPDRCIVETELLIFSLLCQGYMKPSYTSPLENSLPFVFLVLLIGFFLTYGLLLPFLYFAIYHFLLGFSEFSNRRNELHLLTHNLTTSRPTQEKLVRYFQTIWKYGKGSKKPAIIKVFPRSIQKSIFCDVHWEAFKHSELLRDFTLGCKRSLSMHMKADFVQPNTIILEQNREKNSFLYLESGLIQIMADENEKSPVITFSGGTVFGESSLFYQVKSTAIVKTAKFCIIHYLSREDFTKVMWDFPRDMKKALGKLLYRISAARATYERKTRIFPYFVEDSFTFSREKGNIKWIKQQYRSISILEETLKKERASLDVNSEKYFSFQKQSVGLHAQLDHTSLYLSLMAVNDEIINKYEAVCLKTRIPWLMDPNSNFHKIWKKIIIFLILITSIVYPLFIGWFGEMPHWFFCFTIFVTFLYAVDVILLFFTAVVDKHVVIPRFSAVFIRRLGSLSFYTDVAAALPLQLIPYSSSTPVEPYTLGLYLFNSFLKFHKLFTFLLAWNHKSVNKILIRTIAKNLLFFSFVIYWAAMLYKLSGVECVFYTCGKDDWYENFKLNVTDKDFRDVASFYLVFFLALNMPNAVFTTTVFHSFILYFITYFFIYGLILFWLIEILCSCILQGFYILDYRELTEMVNYFILRSRISGQIPKRVNDTMTFQWYYDRGNTFTQENRIIDDLPQHLKDELDKTSLYRTLRSCALFEIEDELFIRDLCRKSLRIALPANSVLITFGIQTMCIYVIHRGYAQLNSFMPNDNIGNVGTPFVLGSGNIFPIMIALNQMPSVVTARTITDCELIVLKLEDVICVMMIHETLKDVVDVIKKIDWKPMFMARPGLSKVDDAFNVQKIDFTKLGKLDFFFQLCKFILYRNVINIHSKKYFSWEVFRVGCILVGLIGWPFVYGCLAEMEEPKYWTTVILLTLETTTWIDLYVRTRVAYYNKHGIYVTHPLATVLHYLTTSFLLDILAFVPYVHVIYLLRNKLSDYGLPNGIIHMGLRCISFYRIFGFMNYINESRGYNFVRNYLKFCLLGVILLNTAVNLVVYQKMTGGRTIGPPIDEKDSAFHFYGLYLASWIVLVHRVCIYFEAMDIKEVIFIFVMFLFGCYQQILNNALFMIEFVGSGRRLSEYQYYLRSFIKYLNGERIEDKYVAEAIEYYEHIWSEMKGTNFNKLFSKFPNILHEDLLISVYKPTIRAVSCLSKANDAFYRVISKNLEEVYFGKGSVILFEKQVNGVIYFIFKGQCEVKEESIVLFKGSMMGDIKSEGIMKHTIVAKTHVVLLQIPSSVFFTEMENFFHTKRAFETEVSQFDDFVKSSFIENLEDDSEKILPHRRPSETFESEFEPLHHQTTRDEKNSEIIKDSNSKSELKEARGILHPSSRKSHILNMCFIVNAFLTAFLVPIFVGIHSLSPLTLTPTYLMDVIWIFKIGITLRTAITNPKTGLTNYNKKAIFHKYLYKWDGLVLDILSVLPIEAIPFAYNIVTKKNFCFPFCYILRFLRIVYVVRHANKYKNRLSMNSYFRWIIVVALKICIINVFVCFILFSSTRKELSIEKCYYKVSSFQWREVFFGYLCVMDYYTGAGIKSCEPDNAIQLMVQILICVWGSYTKASLFSQIVVVISRQKDSQFRLIRQLEDLENYLVVRNISPALLKRVKRYFINLIEYCHEGGMPTFLKKAPDFIKFRIMGDLYVHHLANCFIFQGLNESFLTQLATRLERFVFFPGNYITKKGDVDHSMYFVHRGEIYCLESDKEYISLERPVDLFVKDESFGLLQGLFKCYPHSHTYRAKTLSEVLVLNFRNWEDMRLTHPDFVHYIYERALKGEKATETHKK